MKRPIALLFCLLMITAPLAGCFGGDDEESLEAQSDDGLDDWKTYFAVTTSDLPSCNSLNQGRLYYIEADNQFQVCNTRGWEVINIQGTDGKDGLNGKDGINGTNGQTITTNSSLINKTNIPPNLSSNVWYYDENSIFVDSNGSVKLAAYIQWFTDDPDGNISSVGIDYNRDNVIDIPFSQNSGIYSSQNIDHNEDGYTSTNAFIIPIDDNIEVYRNEGLFGLECTLIIISVINIIAIDDNGSSVSNTLTFNLPDRYYANTIGSGIPGHTSNSKFVAVDGWHMDDINPNIPIPQSDYNWIYGNGSSCFSIPQVSIIDHPDLLTSSSDNLAIVTIENPGDSSLSLHRSGADGNGFTVYCGSSNLVNSMTFYGSDENNLQAGDYWIIREVGNKNCESNSQLSVTMFYEEYGIEQISLPILIF